MNLRRTWQARIDAGGVDCGRCGLPILRGMQWDLGHVVDRALGGTEADGLWPEHARSCNRSAGGRLAHALKARPIRASSGQTRSWS